MSEDAVRIDRTRDEVADVPAYDPELVDQHVFYDRLYMHYVHAPFWTAGYVAPRFPYRH
ncbi:hypothetical protein ACFU46_02855 [Streptomyces griseoincarnatus]